MKAKAIVYTSHAGHTQTYAQMLSAELGIPSYPLDSCTIKEKTEIVFLCWLRAGVPVGLEKARRRYTITAFGIVGMSAGGASQLNEVKEKYKIGNDIFSFYLPGGFELSKTHGINHFMMRIMGALMGKKLKNKEDKTPSDLETLEMITVGKSLVGQENIIQVAESIKAN